jgi:hypothetical protein
MAGCGSAELWGGQFCPQPAFSRLSRPEGRLAARIGRPTLPMNASTRQKESCQPC